MMDIHEMIKRALFKERSIRHGNTILSQYRRTSVMILVNDMRDGVPLANNEASCGDSATSSLAASL